MSSTPTCVIGVGRAGINILKTVRAVVTEHNRTDQFQFVAIDTDKTTLKTVTSETTTLHLDTSRAFIPEAITTYPYLTAELQDSLDGSPGTDRQRPIGRYKLDSGQTFDRVFDTLWETVETHSASTLRSDARTELIIYLIHSLGGGTGSGTFPVLFGMLNEITESLSERGTETYLAGVGVVPELTFDPHSQEPLGDTLWYPNTYAALSDLNTIVEVADEDTSRELKSWAQTLGDVSGADPVDPPTFEFHTPPFDDYWLYGIDPRRMAVETDVGLESYREQANQTIAHSLYAISTLKSGQVTDWSVGNPYIGTFDQSEVRVPHEVVCTYYEKRTQRTATQDRIDETIPAAIDNLEDRRDYFQTLKRTVSPDAIEDPDLCDRVRDRVAEAFPSGAHIVSTNKPADIEQFLDDIWADHGIEGTIVAMTALQDTLDEEGGLPAVEADFEETVQDLWTKYDLSAHQVHLHVFEGKPAGIEKFLDEKIDEYETVIENWDPSLVGQIQDVIPPVGPFESKREQAERILDEVSEDYDELRRARGRWRRVRQIQEAITDRRMDIRARIDDQLTEIDQEITDLQTEQEELEREIDQIERDLDEMRSRLAEAHTSQRLFILPIETDQLGEIEPENAEEVLTSLHAYVEEGLVSEDTLLDALTNAVEFSDAPGATILDRDVEATNQKPAHPAESELWYLFNDANREFRDNLAVAQNVDEVSYSGEDSQVGLLSDPYRIEFVSYHRAGPVPTLTVYQQLEDLAANGTLDDWSGTYVDYRRAFAYVEWYGREIRGPTFTPFESIELTKPPELDYTRVDTSELSEKQATSWVQTIGLPTYFWDGVMMDKYNSSDNNTFTGWQERLSEHGVSYSTFQRAKPSADLVDEWQSGSTDWNEVVDAYVTNLRETIDLSSIVLDTE